MLCDTNQLTPQHRTIEVLEKVYYPPACRQIGDVEQKEQATTMRIARHIQSPDSSRQQPDLPEDNLSDQGSTRGLTSVGWRTISLVREVHGLITLRADRMRQRLQQLRILLLLSKT